ncbi:tetratricopeptide repeat protein [Acidisoma sp. C75]
MALLFEMTHGVDPQTEISHAEQLLNSGRYAEAEAAFARTIVLFGSALKAYLGAAEAAHRQGARSVAQAYLQAAALALPDNPWPLIRLADDALALHEVAKAQQLYQAVLSLASDSAFGHLGLGKAARLLGQREVAVAHFTAAVAVEPDNVWALIELGTELRELRRLSEAEEVFTKLLDLAPENVYCRLGLGQCARARGAAREALLHFTAARDADPDHLWANLELAAELRSLGEFEAAEAAYRRVLTLAPDTFHAPLGLAYTARARGDRDAARVMFERASALDPGNAALLVEIARELTVALRFTESEAMLDKAYSLDPQNVEVALMRAERALTLYDVDEAYAIYESAIEQHPDNLWLHLGKIDALWALGNISEALESVSTLAEHFGPDANIALKWLTILRHFGDYRGAVQLGRTFLNALPHAFWLAVELFQCENLVSLDDDALSSLARIPAATIEEQAVVARMRGSFAELRWRSDEAQCHYEAAVALNPQDPWPRYDLTRMKILLLDVSGARSELTRFQQIHGHVTRLRGRTLNISQTHYGELINDYSTDRDLLEHLRRLSALPPAERVAPLAALASHHPNSTPVSAGLLLALRQSGAFALPDSEAGAAASQTPRQIIQFWDKQEPPPDVAWLMASWPNINPEYRYHRFDLRSAAAFIAQRFPEPVSWAFHRAKEAAQKADLFRLAWLCAEGGVYVDADDRCTAPLQRIIPAHAQLVLYQEDHGTVCNNFIAAMPGHPVIQRALQSVVNDINAGSGETVWFVSGPGALSRAFTHFIAETGSPERWIPQGIVVQDRRQMFAAVSMNCSPGYKRSGGHWSAPAAEKPAPQAVAVAEAEAVA